MATKMVGTHDSGSMQIAQEVRHLFETKTIEDMRKLEANTRFDTFFFFSIVSFSLNCFFLIHHRKEVEDKRQELRNLIGYVLIIFDKHLFGNFIKEKITKQ